MQIERVTEEEKCGAVMEGDAYESGGVVERGHRTHRWGVGVIAVALQPAHRTTLGRRSGRQTRIRLGLER